MPIELSLIISVTSLVASIIGLVTVFSKVVKWVNKKDELEKEVADIRIEQSIVTVGILACLKTLSKQSGVNEDINNAISMIEDHLNKKAHKL